MPGGRPRTPFETRLWAKVDRAGDDECWEWTGHKVWDGYGHIRRPGMQTDARIEEIAEEFGRLQELRDGLEVSRAALQAFIDQPEQGKDPLVRVPAVSGHPAPVPRSAAVSSPPGGGSPATPQLMDCPGCGKTIKRQGMGPHRRACKGKPTAAERPKGSSSEKFLCARCSRPFPDRSARDAHETKNACSLTPTRPPRSLSDRALNGGMVAGMGE